MPGILPKSFPAGLRLAAPVRELPVYSRIPALYALPMDFIAADGISALPTFTMDFIAEAGIPALPALTAGTPQPGQGCRGAAQSSQQSEDIISDWQTGENLLYQADQGHNGEKHQEQISWRHCQETEISE